MSKKMTLSFNDFKLLNKYCKRKKINFLSTPFDQESIDFLKKFKMKYYKIPSGEITNLPYLIKIAKLRKKILLSTGMSNINEISKAINILNLNGTPKKNITVLQCNTEYPTPLKDVNLKAMKMMKKRFGVNVGYSDHTLGIEASLAAVALGAKVIEKHFTLNKNLPGPDHKASITEKELKNLVTGIRKIELALGKDKKYPTESEKKNLFIARNSIVASKDIKKGQKFTKENLAIKRPGYGISPMKYFKILGKKAKKNFIPDELVKI
jgi:N,N'-diacetyllegionaminate synthase